MKCEDERKQSSPFHFAITFVKQFILYTVFHKGLKDNLL